MVVEEPAEAEVDSPAEQHGVQEDADDENLLRDPDEVIIHSECGGGEETLQCQRLGSWRCRSCNRRYSFQPAFSLYGGRLSSLL